jgi:hypothetical protein
MYATTATQTSAVGKYPIVPSAVGAAVSNYAVNAINGTLTIVAGDVVPQTGWWWNTAQPGMGVFIERQGKDLFLAGLAYTPDGSPQWVVSLGPMSSSVYVGKVHGYRNGQTLTGAYVAPVDEGAQTTVQLEFVDAAHATLTWYRQTMALERLEFTGAGASAGKGAIQNGWWWNPAENGRGFIVEVQGTTMFLAGLMYDATGAPAWYLANGTMSGPMQFTGVWQEYGNGPMLSGCWAGFGGCAAAGLLNANVGPVTVVFADASHGTMTLPDGRQIPIERLLF